MVALNLDDALPVLFFAAACIYSIAGLGGASSYLAMLVLAGAPYRDIAPVALVCNVIVTAGSLIQFERGNLVPVRLILPFIAASVPMAFLGGLLSMEEPIVKTMLAACLFVAGIYLLNYKRFKRTREVRIPTFGRLWPTGIAVGGLIGFVSGMVGIGGGIFLAPILYLFRWIDARRIAAASSLFILVNSVAGLCGHAVKLPLAATLTATLPLFAAVFLGSQVGSLYSTRHCAPGTIRTITAVLVLASSIRVVWGIW